MEKKLRGFLIDPEAKTIKQVVHNGDYKQIYEFTGCDCFTVVQIDDVNCVYVDDNSLLDSPRYFFVLKGYPQPLAGKGLVLGVDREGETIGSNFELEELQPLVSFTELSVQGWKTEHEDDVEILPGIRGFRHRTEPIFGPPDEEK